MRPEFRPAVRPTLYFIGVTTRQSSINQVFPLWAMRLGLGECELRGVDLPLHAPAEDYRAVVDFIKRDRLSLGALVTTHKIDLFHACRDQFDEINPLTRALGEIGSIYKRDGRLHGRAVDPITGRLALDAFLSREHWRTGAEALVLGAGGAGTALVWNLNRAELGVDRPARVHVVDRDPARLEKLRRLHAEWSDARPLELRQTTRAEEADAVLAQLPPGSLVVNATGAGKDTPGSPLSDAAIFPARGFAWEFNYRGELKFLAQARAQPASRALHVEDGWTYFLHGWTRVMADVFDCEIPTRGPLFEELGRFAARTRVADWWQCESRIAAVDQRAGLQDEKLFG